MKQGIQKIGKAVSWDYTPVETLRKLIDNKDIEDNERVIKRLKELFDKLLTQENPIPREIETSRLKVLNKNMNESGDINRIRPICIQSKILKLLECSLYFHLHEEIIKKLNKAQIDSIGEVGTEINLLHKGKSAWIKNYRIMIIFLSSLLILQEHMTMSITRYYSEKW